ncbi:MAG: hypothetical protein ABIS69_11395, partial [Sediminibacterium sp.]
LFFLSLSQNWVYPHILPTSFSTEAWKEVFSSYNNISQSIAISLVIALSVSSIATVSGFITSQLIAYHRRKKQLMFLAYLPFIISPVIFAICIRFYFIKMHLTGNVLGVILAQLIITFPYSIIFFLSFWNQRIKQLQALVNTLGGNNTHAFTKIIYPMAKPALLVCFFQCFLISWFEYGLTLVIGYGKVETLTMKVFQFLSEANIYYAALSSCLLVIPPLLLLWINKKFILHQLP